MPECSSYFADHGKSMETVVSKTRDMALTKATEDAPLLRQLRDAGALKVSTAHSLLVSLGLAADLLTAHGYGEAADQLRGSTLISALAGEHLWHVHMNLPW